MAEIKNGILGSFKGKVGPVSGYMRHGRNIMRSAASTVTDKVTDKRQAQREKIRICNAFINAFSGTGIFAKTFPNADHGGSGYNRAMKVLMNSALEGVHPDYRIMYDKFLISKGELPTPKDAAAGLDADGNLIFTWANNSTEGTAKPNDVAVVIAYFPGQSVRLVYSLDAAKRETGFAKLIIPAGNEGSVAETWVGFVSADGLIASNSVYMGSLEV